MQEKCCEKCDLKKLSKTSTIPEYCMDIDCSCHKPQEKSVGEDWEAEFDEFYTLPENMIPGPQREKAIKSFIRNLQKETEERVRAEMNKQLEETLKEIADYDLSAWRKIGIERGYWAYFKKETDDKWRKKIEEKIEELEKLAEHYHTMGNGQALEAIDQATNIIKEVNK
jgi:hypothetical protein